MMEKNHLAKIMRDNAMQSPDRVALRYKNQANQWKEIKWGELGQNIDRTANALLALGAKQGENIGIFAPNCPEWTIADIGIMSLRAVVVPFFATAALTQVEYIARESELRYIFVGEAEQYEKALAVKAKLPTIEKLIVFDQDVEIKDNSIYFSDFLKNASPAGEKISTILAKAESSDLATILYTSGTTGEPKGVMLEHGNFMQTIKIHDIRLNVSENDVSLAFLPLSHIFERAWTFYALYHRMINAYEKNPKQIAETLKEVKPTIMCAVPRLYEKIYSKIYAGLEKSSPVKRLVFNWALKTGRKAVEYRRKNKEVPFLLAQKLKLADKLVLHKIRALFGGKIRFLPCAGAPLLPKINEFFHSVGLFINYGYGLTETTATVSNFREDCFSFKTVGSIMPQVEVKISKKGEIWVRGKTVMRGYYKKPDETANVFEDGWFKTGDAGMITDSGLMVFTERIKDMMKTSGGKYIAPQQIETIIGKDHYIEQIAVIGDKRQYVTALAVPSFEALAEYAKEKHIQYSSVKDLIEDHRIVEFFQKRFDMLQQELAHFERVKKFTLLPYEFSIENGEMTTTLKVRREYIIEKYKDLIEKMYPAS